MVTSFCTTERQRHASLLTRLEKQEVRSLAFSLRRSSSWQHVPFSATAVSSSLQVACRWHSDSTRMAAHPPTENVSGKGMGNTSPASPWSKDASVDPMMQKTERTQEKTVTDESAYVNEYSIHAKRILQGLHHPPTIEGVNPKGSAPAVGAVEETETVSSFPSNETDFHPVPISPEKLRQSIFQKEYQHGTTHKMEPMDKTKGDPSTHPGEEKEEVLLRMWRELPHNPASTRSSFSSSTTSTAASKESSGTSDPSLPSPVDSTPSMPSSRPETVPEPGASSIEGAPRRSPLSHTSKRRALGTPGTSSSPLPPSTGAPPAAGDTFQDSRSVDPNEPTEVKRRRLHYQSQYRGMVEMDLICGHFARCKLESLSREMLMEYDVLLKQLDNELFKWLVMGETPPVEVSKMACFHAMKEFVEKEKSELLGHY